MLYPSYNITFVRFSMEIFLKGRTASCFGPDSSSYKSFHPRLVLFDPIQFSPPRIASQPVLRRRALNRVKNSCVEDVKKSVGQTTRSKVQSSFFVNSYHPMFSIIKVIAEKSIKTLRGSQ